MIIINLQFGVLIVCQVLVSPVGAFWSIENVREAEGWVLCAPSSWPFISESWPGVDVVEQYSKHSYRRNAQRLPSLAVSECLLGKLNVTTRDYNGVGELEIK